VVSLPSVRFACSRNAGRPLVKTTCLPFSCAPYLHLRKTLQDRKRPPTFSVDDLTHGMVFSDFAGELSASADCFRCKVGRDRRASVARGAAPWSEQSDAKQPGHSNVWAVSSAGRTYSRQESIEVRPLFQRDYLASQFSKDVLAIHDFCFRKKCRVLRLAYRFFH